MTSTTFQHKNFTATTAPSVGVALGQLVSALVAWLPSGKPQVGARSATDEADDVRDMAYQYLSSDRGYAEDLFAAADRHERANGVKG